MKKLISAQETKKFLKDAEMLFSLPAKKRYSDLVLAEYPFDIQLLNLSQIYRESRKLYLSSGGRFSAKICSTMRGLSAQDLFNDEIEYTPGLSELKWLKDFGYAVSNVDEEIFSFSHFNEISVFHEQNHRVIWRLLPPAPAERADLLRYLNFAEALVVTLDLVLGDQLGKKNSKAFERMKIVYRPGGEDDYSNLSKATYRKYLSAILASTYFVLENVHKRDILKAVDYVLPGQKAVNKAAVRRGLQLSEIFTRITNPQWQSIYWQVAGKKLKKLQAVSVEQHLYLPVDPLDLEEEFVIAQRIFDRYGL